MSRRSTLLVALAVALLGLAVAIGVDLLDDGETAEGSASPPGVGVVACDGPPTVAVSIDLADGEPQVFVVRPGQAPVSVTPGQVASAPAASPDGGRLAVVVTDGDDSSSTPFSSVATVGIDGAAPTDVTPRGVTYDDAPAWSPDGRTLAFARAELVGDRFTRSLVTVPAAGGEPTTVQLEADGLIRFEAPAWSPDGSRLAYVRSVETPDGLSTAFSVWVAATDGSDTRHLADVSEVTTIDWSADGDHLLVSAPEPEGSVTLVDAVSGRAEVLDGALGGARWSTRRGRIVGIDDGGAIVERPLEGTRLGAPVVLLDRAGLPSSDFGGPAFLWAELTVVPCRG